MNALFSSRHRSHAFLHFKPTSHVGEMRPPLPTMTPDLIASLALGVFCAVVLLTHRLAGSPDGHRRVAQQGSSFFLGLNVMHAGYWMLQPAVRTCVRGRISPATLSWLSLVPAVVGAWGVAVGHWGLAAWTLLISALLDVLDGAVARALGKASPAGAVLDSVLDRYAEFIFFVGIVIYYRDHLAVQLIALAALMGSFLVTYSTAKAEALALTPPRGSMKRSDRLTVLIIATALAPLSQHWLEPAVRGVVWPVVVGLTLIAVLANVSAIVRFTALGRAAGGIVNPPSTERAATPRKLVGKPPRASVRS